MIPSGPVRGEWFRCVSLRRDPLSSEGARLVGGRLNAVGEPAIYLASTPTLAVAENLRLASMFDVVAFPPRLLVTIEVAVLRAADLGSKRVRATLGVTMDDLTCDWRPQRTDASPSQLIGRRLLDLGFEAAICPSAIEPDSANLVLFVQNLDPAQSLRVVGRT